MKGQLLFRRWRHWQRAGLFTLSVGFAIFGLSASKPASKSNVLVPRRGAAALVFRRTASPVGSLTIPESASILDESGFLRRSVTAEEYRAWVDEIHRGAGPKREAHLQRLIGEGLIASRFPKEAQQHLERAIRIAGKHDPEGGLARYDVALAQYFRGSLDESVDNFTKLLKGPYCGYDRKTAGAYRREALACAGYHDQHRKMGIPEPYELDPLCGVAGLAVYLKAQDQNYSRDRLMGIVAHTGEGSTMQDLLDACPKLGIYGRIVVPDKQGLVAMPKPLIAHVERDHFIAVVKADRQGVSYVCSDCGAWPGGEVTLSWKQWEALEPDAFLSMTPDGSSGALAVASLRKVRDTGEPPQIRLASLTAPAPAVRRASALLFVLGTHVLAQGTGPGPVASRCGNHGNSPQCTCPVQDAPTQNKGGGLSGSGAGDPVNIANAELEYAPAPDLVVYNPKGPAVVWSRMYYSLANPPPTGFGACWSDSYNIRIEDNSSIVNGGQSPPPQSCATGFQRQPSFLVLQNAARIQINEPQSAPSSTNPTINIGIAAGLPYIVQWCYDTTTRGTFFKVTTEDRSVLSFQDCGTGGVTAIVYPYRMTDRNGNYINLNWSPMAFQTWDFATGAFSSQGLTSIKNSAGTTLLTVNYDFNYRITSVSDCYNRSVYYSVSAHNNVGVPVGYPQSEDCLDQVSEIVPTGTGNPPVRYQLSYTNYGDPESNGETVPYLSGFTVPSPTGTGTSSAYVYYNSVGELTRSKDANGDQIIYTVVPGQSNATRVLFEDSHNTVVSQYDSYFNSNMEETKRVNGNGQTVYTKTYASPNTPYRPSSVTDGDSHTWNYTWDSFSHLLTATSPKSIQTTYTWSYTNFALGELTQVQRGTMTATSFGYKEPSGLVQSITGPIPGNTSGGTQTANLTYDSMGQLTQVTSPGNNAGSHSATLGYTTDGAYNQAEAINEPITITNSLGKVFHLRYDSEANLSSATDEIGNQETYTYNLANQATSVSEPATGQTGTGHSSTVMTYLYVGGPETAVSGFDESGTQVRSETFSYGAEGESLGHTGWDEDVSYTYTAAYDVASIVDGNSHATSFAYDLSRRVTQASFPLASGTYDTVQIASYDPVGNPRRCPIFS